MTLVSNIKPVISFIDPNFSFDNTSSFHLSIEVSENEFTYAVLEQSTICYLALEKFNTNNSTYLLELLGSYIWKSASVTYVSKYVTLIPEEHFEPEDQEKILQFNFSDSIEGTTMHQHILNTGIVGVFQFPEKVKKVVEQQFASTILLHGAIPVLQYLLLEKSEKKQITYLNVSEYLIEVIVVKEGKLIFHNHFDFQTPEDILYYLLFVFQQLEIDAHKTDLVVYGRIDENDTTHQLLRKYIKEIRFGNVQSKFKFSEAFNELEKHHYLSIFNQYLCV